MAGMEPWISSPSVPGVKCDGLIDIMVFFEVSYECCPLFGDLMTRATIFLKRAAWENGLINMRAVDLKGS